MFAAFGAALKGFLTGALLWFAVCYAVAHSASREAHRATILVQYIAPAGLFGAAIWSWRAAGRHLVGRAIFYAYIIAVLAAGAALLSLDQLHRQSTTAVDL